MAFKKKYLFLLQNFQQKFDSWSAFTWVKAQQSQAQQKHISIWVVMTSHLVWKMLSNV